MYPLGSRGNATITKQVRESLISITGRCMMFCGYWISVSYHEKLTTLSIVSTPDMARVTKAPSSAHLAVSKYEKEKKVEFNIIILKLSYQVHVLTISQCKTSFKREGCIGLGAFHS